MQKLTTDNGLVKWVKPEKFGNLTRENLQITGYEIVDEITIHVEFFDLGLFCFLVDDTELNGIVYINSDELIAELVK